MLEGIISVTGSLLSLPSVNSLVHPELTDAAINAVRQWRYEPTLLNGKPVEVITTVTANFRLEQ
jgi:protein TonB